MNLVLLMVKMMVMGVWLVVDVLVFDLNPVVGQPVFRRLRYGLEHAALPLHELLNGRTMLGLALLQCAVFPRGIRWVVSLP